MEKYSLSMRIMHWLVGILILTLLASGSYIKNFAAAHSYSNTVFTIYHMSLGILMFFLMWIRLAIRLSSSIPAYPPSISKLDLKIAHWTHNLLYILIISMPITGYLFCDLLKERVVFLGLFTLPTLFSPSREAGNFFHELHCDVSIIITVLIGLHLVGMLKHYIMEKENLLKRMI